MLGVTGSTYSTAIKKSWGRIIESLRIVVFHFPRPYVMHSLAPICWQIISPPYLGVSWSYPFFWSLWLLESNTSDRARATYCYYSTTVLVALRWKNIPACEVHSWPLHLTVWKMSPQYKYRSYCAPWWKLAPRRIERSRRQSQTVCVRTYVCTYSTT